MEIVKLLAALLNWLDEVLINFLYAPETDPKSLPMNQEPPPIVVETSPLPPVKSNRERLYDVAFAAIGTDVTPNDTVPDELACAASVSVLLKRALPELKSPQINSTQGLYAYFDRPAFKEVKVPQKGTILVFVTGTGNGSIPHGHCYIVGRNVSPDGTLYLMGNESATGIWKPNSTIQRALNYFRDRGGYQPHYFDVM